MRRRLTTLAGAGGCALLPHLKTGLKKPDPAAQSAPRPGDRRWAAAHSGGSRQSGGGGRSGLAPWTQAHGGGGLLDDLAEQRQEMCALLLAVQWIAVLPEGVGDVLPVRRGEAGFGYRYELVL